MITTILRMSLLAGLLSLSAATPVPDDGDGGCVGLPILAHGTMRFIDVEGGCWQFLGDDGSPFQPILGPPEMYVDGACGWMGGIIPCDMGSSCQVGDIVIVSSFDGFTGWTDLGAGLSGTTSPALVGAGTPCTGNLVTMTLSNAVPNAPVFLCIGVSALNLPFMGGTLVPDVISPPGLVVGLAADGSGGLSLGASWPAGVPIGTSLYLQYWVTDAGGPSGFAASNAIVGTVP